MIFQFLKIYPYTSLAKFEVLDNTVDVPEKTLSIFAANVLQENKSSGKVLAELDKYDADILLFTETNRRWQKIFSTKTKQRYPHKVEFPLNNTYGMLMYSKLPLIDATVKFLVDDSVPSIHTKLFLPSSDTIQVFAIHPTPPMPQHNPSSTDRDAEMMKIALASMESKLPVVIVGDFNDVAWSQTTSLFQRISGLLDIRKVRGLFNTYHADYFIFRWPLDHIFVSEHFRLKRMERAENIGSDHFPIFVDLSFEPHNAAEQKISPPSEEDLQTAKEQIKSEKKHDDEN